MFFGKLLHGTDRFDALQQMKLLIDVFGMGYQFQLITLHASQQTTQSYTCLGNTHSVTDCLRTERIQSPWHIDCIDQREVLDVCF
jgi:hypothetical protein